MDEFVTSILKFCNHYYFVLFFFQVEVMIIVDYCRFGNIRNFLITQRDHFIDQINHDDDTIDATIAGKKMSRKMSLKPLLTIQIY